MVGWERMPDKPHALNSENPYIENISRTRFGADLAFKSRQPCPCLPIQTRGRLMVKPVFLFRPVLTNIEKRTIRDAVRMHPQ